MFGKALRLVNILYHQRKRVFVSIGQNFDEVMRTENLIRQKE